MRFHILVIVFLLPTFSLHANRCWSQNLFLNQSELLERYSQNPIDDVFHVDSNPVDSELLKTQPSRLPTGEDWSLIELINKNRIMNFGEVCFAPPLLTTFCYDLDSSTIESASKTNLRFKDHNGDLLGNSIKKNHAPIAVKVPEPLSYMAVMMLILILLGFSFRQHQTRGFVS